MLNDKERKKFETIAKVHNGEVTRKEASIELNLTLKQIDRLKKIYATKGEIGFIHGNRGKTNAKKKDDSLIKELEELYLSDFYDFNFEQFYERIFGMHVKNYGLVVLYLICILQLIRQLRKFYLDGLNLKK